MPIAPFALPALYDAGVPDIGLPAAGRIHPYVGAAYTSDRPDALRVMAVGINAYCNDGSTSKPAWFPEMFAAGKYPFQRRVLHEVEILAASLTAARAFAGLKLAGRDSVLHTNAVKRWLPMSAGKHAHKVAEAHFEEGEAVFRAELDLLADAGVLPHVVLVFGSRPWSYVWPAFGRPRPAWASAYETTPGALFHHLNRVIVRENGTERPLLLVKLRHPTGSWGSAGTSAPKLVAHPDFKRVASLA